MYTYGKKNTAKWSVFLIMLFKGWLSKIFIFYSINYWIPKYLFAENEKRSKHQ